MLLPFYVGARLVYLCTPYKYGLGFVARCAKGGHLINFVPNDFSVAKAEQSIVFYGEPTQEVVPYEVVGSAEIINNVSTMPKKVVTYELD